MKKQVLLLIPAALLALTACDNKSTQPSGSEGPHFPTLFQKTREGEYLGAV